MKPPRSSICIIAQNAYGALSGGKKGHVGGAEHQTAFLARWLAARGHEVSLVTWDEDGLQTYIDGVRVVPMCSASDGIPGLRFFHPRLSSLMSALRRADADIYYHNSAEYVTGLAALWCRKKGRNFVYSVASDVACDVRLPVMHKAYERVLYRLGVRRADKVLVQTERQRQLLQQGFSRDAVVMPMPCAGPSVEEFGTAPGPAPRTVCWVGRAASMKRLDWLLDIAERMPSVTFRLAVANTENNPYAAPLHARAQKLTNVRWHGTIGRDAIPELYRSTACLCCTSSYEGFPNTFLEAWSHGRPVVTSFDPDGLVIRRNLGSLAGSVEEFVQRLDELFGNPSIWAEKAANARNYYLENHPPEKVMPRMEEALISTRGTSAGFTSAITSGTA